MVNHGDGTVFLRLLKYWTGQDKICVKISRVVMNLCEK